MEQQTGSLNDLVHARLSKGEKERERFARICHTYFKGCESRVIRNLVRATIGIVEDAEEKAGLEEVSEKDLIGRAIRIAMSQELLHLEPDHLRQIAGQIKKVADMVQEVQREKK